MVVEQAFEKIFPKAAISIEHDLIGAARALCGNSEGIVSILGTGSNSCYYDGSVIRENIFSLGYFFGDEGSGAYLGKQMLTTYLHGDMPSDLVGMFLDTYSITNESILDAVYNKPAPSRFLASFSKFINDNREHPFFRKLLVDAFRKFYTYQICCYSKHTSVPVNFVGSVAYHYRDILIAVGKEFNITTGRFIQAPIDGLVEYHLKY
jgi:N-acetylglucosamine kinase-like BadF-type ATPase